MSFRDVIREKKGGPTDSSSPSSLTTNNNTSNNIKKQALNNATTRSSKQQQQQQQTFKSSTTTTTNNQNSDQEEEFSEICQEIEKLLSEINKATLSIQKSTTTILGTNKDTHEHRESLSLIIKKSSQKVESLSNLILKFEHYELLFKNSNLNLKKIQKLKNQMDQILKEYKKQTTNCLITQKETLQQFQKNQEYLKMQQDENSRLLNNTSNYGNNNTSKYGNYQSNKLEYDEEFENEVEFNTKILIEREKDILEVESSIREINGIFKELHFLTIQQDEDLGLIEDRIEETSIRIEQGKENIVKAEKHSKIGRNLFCILLLIFLALGAAIAIVLIVLKVIGII